MFADAFVCLWLLVVCGVASGWGVFLLVNFALCFLLGLLFGVSLLGFYCDFSVLCFACCGCGC